MKKLIILAFTFITAHCFSQAREQQYAPNTNNQSPVGWINHTPGMELQKAGFSFYTGLALQAGGVIMLSVGSLQAAINGGTSGAGLITIGVLSIATGGVFTALSWIHVIRAGRIMDARKISLGPTSTGSIGLICKL